MSAAEELAELLGDLGEDTLERAQGLRARHIGGPVVHPDDQGGKEHEWPPQSDDRVDPAERGDVLPILVDLVIADHKDDRHKDA